MTTSTHGFALIDEREIPEINTTARLYRHEKTGAQLLSLLNDDENKVFGITFRTPPTDSTGLPHIMEHAVLGGSKKYPVKEPFVELIKGSLNTFVNAMTYPDKTVYPVASTNDQDFYNLVDVYLDAVFHPLITPHHLDQEGWHYELDEPDAPLVYKGVVFNEMKGAYSSPDNLLYRISKETLFPDTTYGVDSGGNPEEIPNLTYEQFKGFHETYYHPSNSFSVFYGDDDPDERLRRLGAVLDDFEQREVDAEVGLQSKFDAPKRFTFPYGVDASEEGSSENGANGSGSPSRKGYAKVSWLLPEEDDQTQSMLLTVLSYCLMGTSASPLQKALTDSSLGEDVYGGLAGGLRQMTFTVGIKGLKDEGLSANVDQFESLTMETLESLTAEGFEPEMVEAALNTIEFTLRENNTGSIPRGLAVMMNALGTWLHGRDPLEAIAFEKPLGEVKAMFGEDGADGDNILGALIQEHLLDNSHRTTVILEPDADLPRRQEQAERDRLDKAREAMTPEEIQRIIKNTQTLRELQQKPDDPADLDKIPRLTLADLERDIRTIPIDVSQLGDASTLLHHDLFTNGVVYLNVGFDLHSLPAELLPLVNLFGRSLTQMGTESEDFVKLTQRIKRKTGGVSASTFVSAVRDHEARDLPETAAWFFLGGKSTVEQTDDLLAIMRDVLLTANLDNRERFRQLVLEAKASKESSLIPGGHSVVAQRLSAQFTESGWVNEQMSGLSYLFYLRQLSEEIERDWSAVRARLERLRELLFGGRTLLDLTVDGESTGQIQPQLRDFVSALPQNQAQIAASWAPDAALKHEGLTIPAQVNYVGKGANLYDLGYELDGSVNVITGYMRTTYLWDRVRVQGGAYGAFSRFGRQSGTFSFGSYRDPNLLATLDVYNEAPGWLRNLALDEGERTKAIIGAISGLDAYQLPDAKGYTSLTRYLLGITEEERQSFRDQVLETTAADFHDFADTVEQVAQQGQVVVLGSADAIAKANEAGGLGLEVTRVM